MVSPEYEAPIDLGPIARPAVEKLAWPLPFSATGAWGAPSTVNVTVPVGVPPPELAVTVAVNVTESPTEEGFALDASAVVVAIWLTVCVRESFEAT